MLAALSQAKASAPATHGADSAPRSIGTHGRLGDGIRMGSVHSADCDCACLNPAVAKLERGLGA